MSNSTLKTLMEIIIPSRNQLRQNDFFKNGAQPKNKHTRIDTVTSQGIIPYKAVYELKFTPEYKAFEFETNFNERTTTASISVKDAKLYSQEIESKQHLNKHGEVKDGISYYTDFMSDIDDAGTLDIYLDINKNEIFREFDKFIEKNGIEPNVVEKVLADPEGFLKSEDSNPIHKNRLRLTKQDIIYNAKDETQFSKTSDEIIGSIDVDDSLHIKTGTKAKPYWYETTNGGFVRFVGYKNKIGDNEFIKFNANPNQLFKKTSIEPKEVLDRKTVSYRDDKEKWTPEPRLSKLGHTIYQKPKDEEIVTSLKYEIYTGPVYYIEYKSSADSTEIETYSVFVDSIEDTISYEDNSLGEEVSRLLDFYKMYIEDYLSAVFGENVESIPVKNNNWYVELKSILNRFHDETSILLDKDLQYVYPYKLSYEHKQFEGCKIEFKASEELKRSQLPIINKFNITGDYIKGIKLEGYTIQLLEDVNDKNRKQKNEKFNFTIQSPNEFGTEFIDLIKSRFSATKNNYYKINELVEITVYQDKLYVILDLSIIKDDQNIENFLEEKMKILLDLLGDTESVIEASKASVIENFKQRLHTLFNKEVKIDKTAEEVFIATILLDEYFPIKYGPYEFNSGKYIFIDQNKNTAIRLGIKYTLDEDSLEHLEKHLNKDLDSLKILNKELKNIEEKGVIIEFKKDKKLGEYIERYGFILKDKNDENNKATVSLQSDRISEVINKALSKITNTNEDMTLSSNTLPSLSTKIQSVLNLPLKLEDYRYNTQGAGSNKKWVNIYLHFKLGEIPDTDFKYESGTEFGSVSCINGELTLYFKNNIVNIDSLVSTLQEMLEVMNSKKESVEEDIEASTLFEAVNEINLEFSEFKFQDSDEIVVEKMKISLNENKYGKTVKNPGIFKLDIENISKSILADYDEDKYDNLEIDFENIEVSELDSRFSTIIYSYDAESDSIVVENGRFKIPYKIHNIEDDEYETGSAYSNDFEFIESEGFKEIMLKFMEAVKFISE